MRLKAPLPPPLRVLYELRAILVEGVRIPLRAWLRIAEPVGAAVLAVWRRGWGLLAASRLPARRLVGAAAGAFTPAPAAVAVSLVAAGAIAASQFVDYRAVEVGAPRYGAVAGVAPPPEVDPATSRSAHGGWVLAIDAAALAVIAVAVASGRRRNAMLLVPLAVAIVVIAVVVDAPAGVETGRASLSYQGARGTLRDGFGAEVASACTLALGGILIAAYVPAAAARPARGARARPAAVPAAEAPGEAGIRPAGTRKAGG
jgi:hypothetical protein